MPIRIRQHVNPLARKFQAPIAIPDWEDVYQNRQPIHLDIGCARGRFLLSMAEQNPDVNYLGIEIREPLVESANKERDLLGLTNLHYLFGNMNSSAEVLLKSLPANSLQMISVQFPDPWFKKKHNKRRVIQPDLVKILVDYLTDGGEVFLQSDIKEVAIEMRDRFLKQSLMGQTPKTQPLSGQSPFGMLAHQRRLHRFAADSRLVREHEEWLATNPLPVATERELYVLKQNLPVYRVLLRKSL